MLVENVGLKILDILLCKRMTIQVLDLVLHDIAVLLDVVLLVEFLTKGDDVLARHIGVGVELGACCSV